MTEESQVVTAFSVLVMGIVALMVFGSLRCDAQRFDAIGKCVATGNKPLDCKAAIESDRR